MKYDKTILVTGGMGFIGSNFLNIFVPRYKNYFFINLDCITSAGDVSNVTIDHEENYKFEKVDIRDTVLLAKVFSDYQILPPRVM